MKRQRTVKASVSIDGIGLQTGVKTSLTIKSSPVNSGITFVRKDLSGSPSFNLASLGDDSNNSGNVRRTTIGFGPVEIQTTEHLLSALAGLSIDNAVIELNNLEIPGVDGSAKGFVDKIKEVGTLEQEAPEKFVKVEKAIWCSAKDAMIAVFPSENSRISYTLSYKDPSIGTQFYDSVITEEIYEQEIAPARTFCLEEEAAQLLKMGLGKGANYENTLVMGKTGPVKTKLRFPDEPVRHKVMDLIGDLYILGMPLIGHVVAIKSGHALNFELVKKLKTLEVRK